MQHIAETDRSGGTIVIVSHGAVGTLLYCHLAGQPIARHPDEEKSGRAMEAMLQMKKLDIAQLERAYAGRA